MTTDVFINRTAAFLPFAPVTNEEMEAVLGQVGPQPSRARRIILKSNGIISRHYAIDRSTGMVAMTNAQMTAQAIRDLGEIGPVDMLAVGSSSPDQLMPNHGVMVHGELGWSRLSVVALAGICLSGIAAMQHAWLSLKAGVAQRAVATGSELASAMLRAEQYAAETDYKMQELAARPELAFEKDFLRWMLSDGAGAVLLENQPQGPLSLKVHWIELSSAAHELPACMYCGADKNPDGSLTGWAHSSPEEWGQHSTFAVKQDVRLLNENIARATLGEPLRQLIEKHQLTADQIDWFLPHMSSHYFMDELERTLEQIGLPIPREHWFTNLATCGNTGSASPYIMLNELFHSGRIQKGQRVLMFIPESGRFSSGFVYLEGV